MSYRGKKKIRRLLKDIVRDNRTGSLKGNLQVRTQVVETCRNYLAQLAATKQAGRVFDARQDELKRLVESLRSAASDNIGCVARLRAIERLMRIEGLCTVPRYTEPVDSYLTELLRQADASKPVVTSPTSTDTSQPEQTAVTVNPSGTETFEQRVERLSKIFGGVTT